MFKPSVLGLAVLLSSTALWSAFVTGSLGVTTALIRFLIAIPVAAVMVKLLAVVTEGYARRNETAAAEAERADQAAG